MRVSVLLLQDHHVSHSRRACKHLDEVSGKDSATRHSLPSYPLDKVHFYSE